MTPTPATYTWIDYTLTAGGSHGSAAVTVKVEVNYPSPPTTPTEGMLFFFRMTNAESFAQPCFIVSVWAKDAMMAKTLAEDPNTNGGYVG